MASKYHRLANLLLIVILSGCSPAVTPSENVASTTLPATATSEVKATATSTSTPGITPSRVIPGSTSTPRPTLEPTITEVPASTRELVTICRGGGIPQSPPQDFGFPGTIVYQRGNRKGLFTMGGSPIAYAQLPLGVQEVVVFGFSPDGKWLAYSPIIHPSEKEPVIDTASVILLSSSGEKIEHVMSFDGFVDTLVFKEYQRVFMTYRSYWINNQLLYADLAFEYPGPQGMAYAVERPGVLDPFQGTWQFELLDRLPNRYSEYEAAFSPDMRTAFYQDHSGLVLWDLIGGKAIWRDDIFAFPGGSMMRWASNGATAAVANLSVPPEIRRILLISKDGAKRTSIVDGTFPDPDFQLWYFSWSPDNRYLALIRAGDTKGLYLFDTKLNQYLYRCPMIGIDGPHTNMIWSPDSQFIAFGDSDSPLRLLNVQTGEVIELAQDAYAVGWSDKFPVKWPK